MALSVMALLIRFDQPTVMKVDQKFQSKPETFFSLQELDLNLCKLTTSFEKATAEKVRCQEDVSRTNKTIELANRLVKGLEASDVLLLLLSRLSKFTMKSRMLYYMNSACLLHT